MNIKETIQKINDALDKKDVNALEVMQLSQAAVNLANAAAQQKSTKLMK